MLAQITWYHNIALMDKVKTAEEHIWYEDPYVFDFIPFREDMLERDIEQALVRDVTKLLLELGTGFASVQKQKQCGCRIFTQGYFKADWCKRIQNN